MSCASRRVEESHHLWLLLALVSWGCTMTSDLDDLRLRAKAAQQQPPSCTVNPDDPTCEQPPMVCTDDASCEGYCDTAGTCRPETCRDSVWSSGETGIDCGGIRCEPCADGKACRLGSDCTSTYCENDLCVAMPSMPIPPPDAGAPDGGGGSGGGGSVDPIDSGVDADVPVSDCVPGCTCMGTGAEALMFCTEIASSWASAASFCRMHDLRLISIGTRTENDMLCNWAESLKITSFWIGASDRSEETDWDWTDGTDLWNGGPASCPDGAVEGPDNRCYLFTASDSYTRSYDTCVAEGPGWALTTIQSSTENEFIQSLVTGRQFGAWIGANDLAAEGTWGWVVADPDPARVTPFWMGGAGGDKVTDTTYTNWGNGDPGGGDDENCASMDGSGRWTDGACGFSGRPGVCEGPMQGPIEGTYHAFAETEPQVADCLSVNTGDFHWYAQDCALSKPFVCAAPTP